VAAATAVVGPIAGTIAPGGDHEPDDVAEALWRHHADRGEFQLRLGFD
jgi:hypothetical protein